MNHCKTLVRAFFLLLIFCGLRANAQTTVKALTQVNTAACPATGVLPPHCLKTFPGAFDKRAQVQTVNFNAITGNVSNEDLHKYLEDGSSTRVFANFMLSFCVNGGVLCHGNVQTGYKASDLSTVGAQVEDLKRRHIDGAIMTWEGNGSAADQATLAFQKYVNSIHCKSGPQHCEASYFIMYDGPSLTYRAQATGVPQTSGAPCSKRSGNTNSEVFQRQYENCVVAHMRNDMCYMNGKHWGNDAYEKSGGRPILQIFINETVLPRTGGSPSWEDVWKQLDNWNSDLHKNCGFAPYNSHNGKPLIIFQNAGGFSHEASDGSFYWIQPSTGVRNQFTTNISPFHYGGTLDHFYQTAKAYQGEKAWGAAFKGFNDIKAPWGRNRVMDQQCGQTWVKSLVANSEKVTGLAFPYLQVVTWNDYSEGTEIESGIDNCYTVNQKVVDDSLHWSLKSSDAASSSLSTVSHIEIYDSRDGQKLTLLASLSPETSGTLDLSKLSKGTHHLYTRMVGKNSILNRISSDTIYNK